MTANVELREAVAREIRRMVAQGNSQPLRERSEAAADSILDLLEQQGGVGEGWVVVPVEPTEAMLDACAAKMKGMTFSDYPRAQDATLYRAMIAGRPAAPAEQFAKNANCPAVVEGQWRGIESAPRDGSAVLGCWLLSDREPLFGVVSWGTSSDEYAGGEEGWLENNQAVAGLTHWMPLPPPPAQGGRGP